ncbi:hypothetical protein PR048_015702 [Dryococelus australis]|uniref:Uncharacterized protein n=1 Tax=Dryococelus australis TaxID=614101 RepID=A0ABQ9HHP0_9NEOP|nr:hypothetical protein PR048_015702 [Dryococelus australis]
MPEGTQNCEGARAGIVGFGGSTEKKLYCSQFGTGHLAKVAELQRLTSSEEEAAESEKRGRWRKPRRREEEKNLARQEGEQRTAREESHKKTDHKKTLQLAMEEETYKKQETTEHQQTNPAENNRRPPPIIITRQENFLKTAKQIAQANKNRVTLVYSRQGGRINTDREEDYEETIIANSVQEIPTPAFHSNTQTAANPIRQQQRRRHKKEEFPPLKRQTSARKIDLENSLHNTQEALDFIQTSEFQNATHTILKIKAKAEAKTTSKKEGTLFKEYNKKHNEAEESEKYRDEPLDIEKTEWNTITQDNITEK